VLRGHVPRRGRSVSSSRGGPSSRGKEKGHGRSPVSRLQLAEQEIDRTFGDGYAAANPQLVAAVMAAASSDYAAQLVARAIEHVAVGLVEEEEAGIRVRP
jgi:hypothetical protein